MGNPSHLQRLFLQYTMSTRVCHLKPSFNKLPEMFFFLARKSNVGLSTCTKPIKIEGKGRRKLHKQDEKNLKIRQIEEKDQERKKRKPIKENKGRPPGTRVMRMTMMKMFFVWYMTYMTPLQNTTDEMVSWVQCDGCLSWCHIGCTELEENNVTDRWPCMKCSEVWC